VGGRYQTTQVCFKGCSDEELIVELLKDDDEALLVILVDPSFSRFSPGGDVDVPGPAVLAKSRTFPGDLGVFAEEPNEANAPDPSPNAEEAPEVVGEETPVVVKGATALKGLCFPCEELSPPNRLDVL
jgi:hypothetical protein